MISQEKKLIRDILLELQTLIEARDVLNLRDVGICLHVKWYAENAGIGYKAVRGTLQEYFLRWPKCVSKGFPVPASEVSLRWDEEHMRLAADEAFFNTDPVQMWLDGEYAYLRQELIQFIINEINNEEG